MERLTYRVNIGVPEDVILVDYKSVEECQEWKSVLERLAYYEDLEEQGLLLKLPCKVGDTLYRIDTDEKIKNAEVEHLTIENIVICGDGEVLFKYNAYGGIICHLENIITDKPYLDFYRVFLTQAEAEEALKRMKREEKGGKVSKSILIIDTPKSCDYCPIGRIFGMAGAVECKAGEETAVNRDGTTIPNWCPLKEISEKKPTSGKPEEHDRLCMNFGYNSCIDEILTERDENEVN